MLPVILWIIMRVITSLLAGLASSIRPMTPLEVSFPFFPPHTPIHAWLERAFLSPWLRWDTLWYERIVSQGYSAADGTAQFHPLYPWMAVPFTRLGLQPILSLLIVSALAGIALYYFFLKLAHYDLPNTDAIFAMLLFALAPPAFIIFAPYSEALFLLTAVVCMIFLRQRMWWLAGLMGGLAALTRQQGIILVIPMGWELWENTGRRLVNLRKQWWDWFSILLIPIGASVWLIYRAFHLDDLHINLTNFQEFIYSTAISPSATKVVPMQQFVWPWLALKDTFIKLITQPDTDIWVNVIAALIFLSLFALSWGKMRVSYRIYSLLITIVSFSYYTGSLHPCMGLPRHLFLAFPIYIGLAAVIKNQWIRLLFIGLSILAMSFMIILFVFGTWVP
jgi:Gpi18-like mannosyltransferase